MLDITASNETFNVDKAMGADLIKIMMPNGETSRPSSTYKGHRKSVADYFLKESGTYKITNNNNATYMTTYEIDGVRKRLSANKAERGGKLLKDAKAVQTGYRYSSI